MADTDSPQPHLVVVGASAGGIDALSTLVSTLPADFPAPLVIAQHLDPRRPSHLSAILANRTSMAVRLVADRATLEPGVVYLVPSNRHVTITDHEVTVTEAGEMAPRPSVNRLFESAAESFGEGLVAVILSGTGSDGAAGARHVKAMGGTVIIQNPDTASFPEMPQSLSPTIVDIVAELESIGPLLTDLVSDTYETTAPDEDRLLRTFLNELREQSGIDFASYKRPTILRRLQRRMYATGTSKLRDYIRYVHRNPGEAQRLTSSFLIKVTEFFRDADLFEYLRTEILPSLIESARQQDNGLRIWSAGCATGEEAYSIAILVCEALGDSIDRFNLRIFATDLDADAVTFARRGVYPAAALANLSEQMIDRYFTESEGEFEIKKRVRALTVFGQHDLGQRAPFPRIDLALCRNVLIYFTPELQKRALHLFAFSLKEGGYLVLGKAETTSPLPEHFTLEQSRLKIYRRHGDRVLIPPVRIRETAPLTLVRSGPGRPGLGEGQPRVRREPARGTTAGERAESLLIHLPVGVATVDQRYDIQWINGAARRLLGIHTAAIGSDFIHLAASLPAGDLRQLIDAAFSGERCAQTFELAIVESVDDEGPRFVAVSCQPHHGESASTTPELVSIVVTDVTQTVVDQRAMTAALTAESARVAEMSERLTQVTNRQRELLRANDELAASNAELRGGNQELLVANEEVQAASEEVETLNEELQATNEELETLNEELQATVEELNTANDDLEARSIELQELAAAVEEKRRESEAGRARLEAVLEPMPLPILLVDETGQRMLANSAFEAAFPPGVALVDRDGRPLVGRNSIETRSLGDPEPSELVVRSRRPGSDDESWFVAETLPVRAGGIQVGSVVTFTPCPTEAECAGRKRSARRTEATRKDTDAAPDPA
jgi:two-component system CheB/CheR fusion protein